MKRKNNKKTVNKKNLRRISVVVNSQTLWHLQQIAALSGYGSKDIGRVIDKIMRGFLGEGF